MIPLGPILAYVIMGLLFYNMFNGIERPPYWDVKSRALRIVLRLSMLLLWPLWAVALVISSIWVFVEWLWKQSKGIFK